MGILKSIINFISGAKIASAASLTVDGIGGANTVKALQKYLGTTQDGVISGQKKSLRKYYPALTAVKFGSGGSACVKAMQKWLGITQDGIWGVNTSKALQKKLGVTQDGIAGVETFKALQKFLNRNLSETVTPIEKEPQGSYCVIDVSDWQSQIDWSKVKKAGVTGAIIRYADGTTLDKRFAENMKNAKANGLHIGSYIFSRAKTKAQAETEAERLFNACKPYDLDMPLYIDLEVSSLSKYANTVAQAFLNKMASLGARGGVYANLNWWNNYLVDTATNYSASPFWIAQYNSTMTHKNPSLFGMWQYTSSGSVSGISGRVDMNHCYIAYWENTVESNGSKIGAKANEYAYTTNTSKAAYKGGSPTAEYAKGLESAYPDRSKWGVAPRKGASCDVFVGVCVRNAGVDKDFPRGLDEQIKHLEKSDKFALVSVTTSTVRDGDIILYSKSSGGGHICIAYGGKTKEAGYQHYYPKTTSTLSSRLSTSGKKWLKVYRAK